MGEFKVKLLSLRNAVSAQQEMCRELSQAEEELYQVKSSICFKIAAREGIDRRLDLGVQSIHRAKGQMEKLSSALLDIACQYEKTELSLSDMGGYAALAKWISVLFPGLYLPGISLPEDLLNNQADILPLDGSAVARKTVKDNAKSLVDYFMDGDSEEEDGERSVENKVKDWSKRHSKTLFGSKTQYNLRDGTKETVDLRDEDASKEFGKELKKMKLAADVKLVSVGGAVEGAWLSGKGLAGSVEGTHISAKALFLSGEAHGKGYCGLGELNPGTGKIEFHPGISGSVGASVSAFTAEEEALLGSNMLGVYAKSSQTAGKAGVEAEASLGFNEDGQFNAYAGAGAEAIAGEITGAAGAKILGSTIGIKGSLNCGVGAHVYGGYQGGKLSVDIGASLGVGASVGLEIDVSGTVDAVCDGAEAAWDGIIDIAENAWDAAQWW